MKWVGTVVQLLAALLPYFKLSRSRSSTESSSSDEPARKTPRSSKQKGGATLTTLLFLFLLLLLWYHRELSEYFVSAFRALTAYARGSA